MFKLLLILILIPIVLLLFLGIRFFSILYRLMGGSRRGQQSPFGSSQQSAYGSQQQQQQQSYGSQTSSKPLHKHYGKDEGEYVEFEEIKE